MSRVRTFFVQEAEECLDEARTALESAAPDRQRVYGAVRRFRGSAQLARFGTLAATARALERQLRPAGDGREADWEPALAGGVAAGLDELETGMEAVRAGRMDEDTTTEATVVEQEESMESGEPEAEVDPGTAVPAEALEYRGEAALDRARSLRGALEDAVVSEEPVGPILDELFDLIRLGSS